MLVRRKEKNKQNSFESKRVESYIFPLVNLVRNITVDRPLLIPPIPHTTLVTPSVYSIVGNPEFPRELSGKTGLIGSPVESKNLRHFGFAFCVALTMNTEATTSTTATTTTATATSASVAVKLPDFWKSDPAMWFAQAEAQFVLAGVTRDETKFYHIIAKVDQTVLCHISDLVANPPQTNKYDAIKERLLNRFEMSPQAKMEKLLNSCDLGDMKPTHLLAKMQDLAAGLRVEENLMKMLFLQRLPQNIRSVLAIHDGTLSKLAEMADKMLESTFPNVAAATVPTSTAVPNQEELSEQIAFLTAEIRKLKSAGRSRSRSTSRARRVSESDQAETCWYHRVYGNRARQCRSPCRFQLKSKN